MKNWVKCRECDSPFPRLEVLTAPHPFDTSDGSKIEGCPYCKSAGDGLFILVCDEPDCQKEASAGTPTKDGYRNTCYLHIPKEKI